MIQGKDVTLRMGKLEEQKLIYEMGLSTEYMRGRFALDFPNGFESFAKSYYDIHFDNRAPSVCGGMIISLKGEPIGFISYCSISYGKIYLNPGIMEVDIWMNGEENCGKGLGQDAVITLMDHLHAAYDIRVFFMCPEKSNPRAVRAYEKAGFAEIMGNEKQRMIKAFYAPDFLEQEGVGTLSEDYAFMVKEYR